MECALLMKRDTPPSSASTARQARVFWALVVATPLLATPSLASAGLTDILSDSAHSWPVFRAAAGAGALFGLARPVSALDVDVMAGFRFAVHDRAFLAAELGYGMFLAENHYWSQHGTLGLGPALYISPHLTIGWMPRFVAGAADTGFVAGVRNTATFSILLHSLWIETGHTWLRAGGTDLHELRIQAGIDLAGVTYALVVTIAGAIH